MAKKKLTPEFAEGFELNKGFANELQSFIFHKAQENATVHDGRGQGTNVTKCNAFVDGANFFLNELIIKGLLNDFNCTNVRSLYFSDLRKEWVIEYIDGTYNEFESIVDVVNFLVTDGE